MAILMRKTIGMASQHNVIQRVMKADDDKNIY